MSFLVPQRVDEEELLDEENAPWHDRLRSLRDLIRINRYLGGTHIYRTLFRRAGIDSSASILDIGTGTSDLLASLRWNGARIGLDFSLDHLLYGRQTFAVKIPRVAADAKRLPFADECVDVVTSAHFFHHFSPEQNVEILRECLRVARRAVIINDTRRHHAPLLLVRILSALRLVGTITRFDAPASVLRGYTVDEARDVAAQLAVRMDVRKVMPYRFGIILWK